jgi:hypothetical protein
VRRLLKFFHEIGAIGLMGAMASLLILIGVAPPPAARDQYALVCDAMGRIATWILFPSLALTLVTGLAAIGITPAWHNAGWAWVKAGTGVLVFAGGLHAVAPIQQEAQQSALALAGKLDPAALDPGSLGSDQGTMWALLVVSTANVVLAIWRPRLTRMRASQAETEKVRPAP